MTATTTDLPPATPCRIRWIGETLELAGADGEDLGKIESGDEGVLLDSDLALFLLDLAPFAVDADSYELVHPPPTITTTSEGFGGWDGVTITPEFIKAVLSLPSAIPTLVEVMKADPSLGPKVVEGVMAGMV
jgi:hypothetical protein